MLLKYFVPDWITLNQIYSGWKGKVLYIIMIAPFILDLANYGLVINRYYNLLVGALAIWFGHLLTKSQLPSIIHKFKNEYEYLNYLTESIKNVHFEDEYQCLKKCDDDILSKFEIKNLMPIANGVSILGRNMAATKFGRAEFYCQKYSKLIMRTTITILFVVGMLMIYNPVIIAIYKILLGG